MHVLIRERDRLVALERRVPREHVIQHAPERVDVGARVDLAAGRLLRRDVRRRAERLAGHRERHVAALQARDPEVADHRVVVGRQEDVRRLDVAVHYAVGVRRRQAGRDVGTDRRRPLGAERAARPQLVGERRAPHELHHEVRPAFVVAGVVHRHHVRIVDPRKRLRLAEEPLARIRIVAQRDGQPLERDLAIQRAVGRGEDLAHAATAERTL